MILKMTPVHLADVKELAGDLDSKPELRDYLKEFSKLDKQKADALLESLKAMGNHKIKEESMIKIVDLLPRDADSLTKIFNELSLDEKEINDILAAVKEY
jgi:DNA-directed RNA polymerase subunit F